ncbi:hypothetical protein H5410_062798 [Solanum commersonii]|uniref:SWIM-type domain-containing protein n=1 Tax=Solanum commersonii TaxID=4109 RepID=A0A9J5WDE0_SOLCO|nr:hypothetical protein H5410_062798 [Solanum commersonii]
MAVTEFVVAGMPIALHRNGSYDDMIANVIETSELTCEPNDLGISYQMNEREKMHPTFIKNDRHMSLYMLDIGIDGSRPTLRINVNARPTIEPTNSFNGDNNSIGNERLGDHSKKAWVQKELGSQSNHSFSDETNLCINQTFSNKNELQLLLAKAAAEKSFDFATVNSCTKYLKMKCEFDNHFVEFKNKCPAAAVILEHDIGFEKWSKAHFPGNRYDMMTTNIIESLNAMLIDEKEYPVVSIFNSIAKRFGELSRERHAYTLKSMGNQMVPAAEKIARKKMIEGDSLYVENIIGDDNQFIVFGAGVTVYVDLLEKSCSCREYDLINLHCAHAMTILRSMHDNEYGMSIYEHL